MKKIVLGLVLALSPVAAGQALAANCTDGNVSITSVPNPQTATVAFDQFIASVGDPATCALSVPIDPLPAGTIAAYSADYRGFLLEGTQGRITVDNDGHITGVVVDASAGDVDGLYLSSFAGSNAAGTAIESDIDLTILGYTDPGTQFTLDTIDYLELARTTTAAIQASADQLAADRTAVVTHLNGTADLLNGAGQPLESPDGVGFLGAFGSATLGVNAHMGLGEGFTALGGVAYIDQSAGGASASGILASGALRYIAPDAAMLRPYGEVGLHVAPSLDLSFSRTYTTSTGTTSASADTTGSFFGGYVKGGVLIAPDASNTVVLSATLAKDWLATGAATETLDGSNLFAASTPAQTGSFDTFKLGADWTTTLTPELDVTFSAAVGHTFAENAVVTDVAFAGPFTGAAKSETFAEYGVHANYALSSQTSVGAFVFGTTGESSGTHIKVGGDFHVHF
jgi:hypothetical protein